MFGSLVHQTIEDVHKSFLRGETFDDARIDGWFNLNYASLSLAMKAYLDPSRKNGARRGRRKGMSNATAQPSRTSLRRSTTCRYRQRRSYFMA